MKIDIIAGTRPNFIKIAPIVESIERSLIISEKLFKYRIIHTGQHYDRNMSESFFKQLNIPTPEFNLNVGSGTQAKQTAKIMSGYENVLKEKGLPDLCIVVGDVNSTLACSIVAKRMGIKVAHVEGGLRSGDLTMPEEINRIATDSISDYFFTTSENANLNLINCSIPLDRIFFVGNTMIDSLFKFRKNFKKPKVWEGLNLKKKNYILLTLHRPTNVDEKRTLKELISEIIFHSREIPIVFPAHPRTQKMLDLNSFKNSNLFIIEPLSYLEFNYLVERCKGVITDSGGVSEETTVMNIPCMTIRDNTERPETIEMGTNVLLGTSPKAIKPAMEKLFSNKWKNAKTPPLWDGRSSERIVKELIKFE